MNSTAQTALNSDAVQRVYETKFSQGVVGKQHYARARGNAVIGLKADQSKTIKKTRKKRKSTRPKSSVKVTGRIKSLKRRHTKRPNRSRGNIRVNKRKPIKIPKSKRRNTYGQKPRGSGRGRMRNKVTGAGI